MLKKLVVLGTGGTIAGKAASADDNVSYQSAQIEIGSLLQAVPGLSVALGDHILVSEQVLQVDSKDMEWDHWLVLLKRVIHSLGQSDVTSVVITHGTDTLEETAFFLSRALPYGLLAKKPVVLTCAMRPATALTADGPQNLRDAICVARSAEAKGVLVVCAATIHAARDVQKVHPYRLDAFDSGEAGPVGFIENDQVRWLHSCPIPPHGWGAVALERLSTQQCPRVEIVVSHAGASGGIVRAICKTTDGEAPVRGIVVATTGNGSLHADLEIALLEAQKIGIRVLRSMRCTRGQIVQRGDKSGVFPHSKGLSPVKARIELILEILS